MHIFRVHALLGLACSKIDARSAVILRYRGGAAGAADEKESRATWQGPFRFPDGSAYYGETNDGRLCGQGEWRSAQDEYYIGGFKDDVFHGHGSHTDAAGNTYTGDFVDGLMHGAGTYRHADGRADVGGYINGADSGPGARWSPDRQQAWRLHDGQLVSQDAARDFDVEKDQISLAEAANVASALGAPVPPSVYEVSAQGLERQHSRLAARETVAVEMTPMDDRLAGTSVDGRTGFLVAHSASPVVPAEICDKVVAECEARAARLGGWTTKRHAYYPTTDVPLQRLPGSLEWFRSSLLPDVAWPFLSKAFGFALPDERAREDAELAFRVSDAFVVKYNASSGQRELKPHRDGSVFSFNIALNDLSEYEGGGTSFRALGGDELGAIRSPKGHLMAHSSALMHGGHPLVSGTRYILVVFVTMESKHAHWAASFNEHVASADV